MLGYDDDSTEYLHAYDYVRGCGGGGGYIADSSDYQNG